MTDERRPKAPPENPTPPQEGVGAMVPRTDDEPAPLSERAARDLTVMIQRHFAAFADVFAELCALLVKAYLGQAWLVLGYTSWGQYLIEEVRNKVPTPKLTAVERREMVAWLAERGLSTRAIAPVVGAGRSTVSRDLAAGVPDGTREVTGRDGKIYVVRPNPDATDEELVAEHLGFAGHRHPDPNEQQRQEAQVVDVVGELLDEELRELVGVDRVRAILLQRMRATRTTLVDVANVLNSGAADVDGGFRAELEEEVRQVLWSVNLVADRVIRAEGRRPGHLRRAADRGQGGA
jgi:hypothetical protein